MASGAPTVANDAPLATSAAHAGRLLGRFLLGERIAAGGMATVYRATTVAADDPLADHDLAIKVLHEHLADDDEFVRMFRDEGRIATRLIHPNIVRVFEIGDVDGRHFLVMERIDGRSLAKVLDALSGGRKQMPRAAAVAIVRETLNALDHVHALCGRGGRPLGLVHRDISPHNILVASDERVLLTDFGIARGEHRSDRTRTGTIKGKLHYMSPEQARGSRVDARSDLYALGVVAYEMLTNRILLGSEATLALQARVASGRIELDEGAMARLPEDLRGWLVRTLQAERDQRWGDARAMLVGLDATRAATSARFKPGTLVRLLDLADPAQAPPMPQLLFRPEELSKPRMTPQPVPLPEGMVLTPQRAISGVFVGAGHISRDASAALRLPSDEVGPHAANAHRGDDDDDDDGDDGGDGGRIVELAARRRASARLRAVALADAAAPAMAKQKKSPRQHTNRVLAAEAAARRRPRSLVVRHQDGDNAHAVRRSEVISLRAAGVDVEAGANAAGPGVKPPRGADARAVERPRPSEPTRLRVQTERRVAVAGVVAWGCVAFLLFATLLEVWNARLELPRVDEASFTAMADQMLGRSESGVAAAPAAARGASAMATADRRLGRTPKGGAGRASAKAGALDQGPPAAASAASANADGVGGGAKFAMRPAAPPAPEVRNDRFLPRGVEPASPLTTQQAVLQPNAPGSSDR